MMKNVVSAPDQGKSLPSQRMVPPVTQDQISVAKTAFGLQPSNIPALASEQTAIIGRLEEENARLRKKVSDLTRDKLVLLLQRAAWGK